MTKELKIWRTNMWPYTEEENQFISETKESKSEWDYDTYGHGA